MKNDKKIEKKIREIKETAEAFISDVEFLGNQCASTDRIVDKLIQEFTELKELREKNHA